MSVVLYKVTDNSNARLTACSDRRQRKHQMCASLTNNIYDISWWRHQMETFSALLAICAGNSPVTGDFPAQRPETRSVDVFIDVHFNELLSKQIEEQASKPVGRMVYFLLITFVPAQKLFVNIYMHNFIWELLWDDFVFFGLPIVSCSMINNLILGCLWPLVFLSNLLIFGVLQSLTSHDVFALDLLSEYRIQHGAIGPFMSHLATQLGCSAGEFQALQLIVLAAFGVVD